MSSGGEKQGRWWWLLSRWGGEQVGDIARWCGGGGGDHCRMW